MLASKRDTEKLFFESFLERAIKGEQAYLDIVKPIVLEASKLAKGEISVMKVQRAYFRTVLQLKACDGIKKVTEDNLMLPEMLKGMLIQPDFAPFGVDFNPHSKRLIKRYEKEDSY